MSRDRFFMIRQFFHINDDSLAVPSDQTGHDKLHKIRPMYDELRENLKSIPPEERQSVDEQMIPFKGRLSFKQYLKDKPHSWGVKVFTRAGVSGIVYDLEIYTGKGSVLASPLGLGADVVLRLIANVPRRMTFKLQIDNFIHLLTLLMPYAPSQD